MTGARAVREELDRTVRASKARLTSILSRETESRAIADDMLAEAFERALRHWPETGVPLKPDAWLLTTARRCWLDQLRRDGTARRSETSLALLAEERETTCDDEDPRLALMFAAAHEAIDEAIRTPLIMQAVLGLSANQIAPLFLTTPQALSQKLVRAKKKIKSAGIAFAVPDEATRRGKLPAVLSAIYAAFSAAHAHRYTELMDETLFLASLCAHGFPDDAEAQGLVSLCLFIRARYRPEGVFEPLSEQDGSAWNSALIALAEDCLRRAAALRQPGRYQIEAALQSAKVAEVRTGRSTSRDRLALYDTLLRVAPSLGAITSRAALLVEVGRPGDALLALDGVSVPHEHYQPWWATRAAALAAIGQYEEACTAYDEAIRRAPSPAVADYLMAQREAADPY